MLIDTHCHLNLADAFPNPAEAVAEGVSEGVGKLIVIGIDIATSNKAIELAEEFKEVYAVAGVHPNYAANYDPTQLETIRQMLAHPKVVALGEVGLDYHWDYATKEQQYKVLRDQLPLAREAGKPIVFHCREAYSDLLDLLEQEDAQPYLFHCFGGDETDAKRAQTIGAMFGVDGPITYKKADALRSIVRDLPHDKVLIETDSPYMTPVPYRGKPNRPAYVRFVNNALASIWEISLEECAKITTSNAERFFGI